MKKDVYDLSKPQESIWLTEQYFKNTNINRIICYSDFSSKTDNIDFDKLKIAINAMLKNNDAFQIRLFLENGNIKQYFSDFKEVDFPIYEISSFDDFIREDCQRQNVFNLFENPLYEFKLFKYKGTNTGGVLANFHHIISDATSASLTPRQFTDYYNSLIKDDTLPSINPNDYSYIQYLNDEKDYLQSNKFQKDKAYWEKVYETIPEVATIYSSKNSDGSINCNAERLTFTLDTNLTSKINTLCSTLKVSAYNFFMAVFGIYISRVSTLNDFVIGTPILNRTNFREKNTFGMYISTIPFRIRLDNNMSFRDLVSNIAGDSLSMLRHQKYSYQYIIENLRKKDPSLPNLYKILLSYQINKASNENYNYTAGWTFNNCTSNDLDIHIYDLNTENIINIAYDYNISMYDKKDIDLIHPRILNIINQILYNADILINDIDIVTHDEKDTILNVFNDTRIDSLKDKSIIDLFEANVNTSPNKIALVSNNIKLTYKDLNELSNKLAYELTNNGIRAKSIVGILVNRSPEMIIGLLAILKCGATYLPLDPDYPNERICYILDNSKAQILLVNDNTIELVGNEYSKINISLPIIKELTYNTHNINTKINPTDLMYLIYTSGTTGNPKGVMVTYDNVYNFVKAMKQNISFASDKVMVSVTTICFDIFGLEVWCTLTSGMTLVLANEKEQNVTELLNNLCLENHVNMIQTTPSRYLTLINDKQHLTFFNNITDILVGGEGIPANLLDYFHYNFNANIFNMYGPTETTIWSTMKDLSKTDTITIGSPILNTTCYILDNNLNILPYNTPGILYIGGDGVSNGYYNNESLTNEKFIVSPFDTNKIIYNTNDLAYWTKEGEIVHIGRNDFQIKLNGYRVELSEIESTIEDFPNIQKSAVKYDSITKKLYAFYTSSEEILTNDLKAFLLKKLPSYMIPYQFIQLDNFPYTPNGKLDRNALKLPSIKKTGSEKFIKPSNDTEKKLYDIIKDILKIDSFSLSEDIFGLGMDSINTLNLSIKIESIFNKDISSQQILHCSSILDLAKLIDNYQKVNIKKISSVPLDFDKEYRLSSAQKRIYYATKLDVENNILYNMPGCIILNKKPDINKLNKCFRTLIQRHSSLRTYFGIASTRVYQKVNSSVDFEIKELVEKEKSIDDIIHNFVKTFDLSKAPLFRVCLIEQKNQWLLLFDMHHIISDGMSLSILTNELCKLYNGETLPKLQINYTDYAEWEYNRLKSDDLLDSKTYWINQFKDGIPILDLPTDYVRSADSTFEGSKVYKTISSNLSNKLQDLAKNLSVSNYMILLAVYYVLLFKYSGQEDIVVGTPIVGRDREEFFNIIGMFVNYLPLNNHIDSSMSFSDFLNIIKTNCIAAFNHQDYPFDNLVNNLNVTRDINRNPLFDTMFIYQNNGFAPVSFGEITGTYYLPDTKISKLDLSLEVIPMENDELKLNFEYRTKLFNESFIERFSNHYINILNAILDNPNIEIANIDMLSTEESHHILNDFNDTILEYPYYKTITQLFEEQVLKTPNKTAIISRGISLSFDELNRKSNQLAHYLRNSKISYNKIVGIMMNRSVDFVICMLGILKSGGAYLPIDPNYPKERIDYIIKDSGVNILLTSSNFNNTFSDVESIVIDFNNRDFCTLPDDNLDIINLPNDLAYLIYTSGSTGRPKGVIIKHQNVNNLVAAISDKIVFDGVFVSVNTFCFDMFVLEAFLPLEKGLCLVIADEQEQNIPKLLNCLCLKNNVTIIQTTPTRMSLLLSDPNSLDYLKNLKTILLGGEPFPTSLFTQLKSLTNAKIYNMYGPTETTVWSSVKELTDVSNISIGKPIGNTNFYILDKNKKLLPPSIPGELYVGGDGVGNGYFHREQLTQKKFIPNPYNNFESIYDTGDIAKWTETGEVICMGRSDFQVKIRGLRIELEEIENRILQFPNIEKVVVCVKKDKHDRDFLCAYFVSDERIKIPELKKYLLQVLPTYMVPNKFMQLQDLKYTPNGKVDRKSLPEIEFNTENDNIVLASTPTELKLTNLFENLLGISPISIYDNFFEIGGDSMLALKVQIALLNDNIDVTYADIFKYNTIYGLANKIDNSNDDLLYTDYDKYDFSKINELLSHNSISSLEKITKIKLEDVVLTGATGFLGSHILATLLDNTSSRVYCLLRPDPSIDINTKLLHRLHYYFGDKYDSLLNDRFFAISADITKKGLALNLDTLKQLSKNVSCVINSAAIVKHYGDYEEFKKLNVTSVDNLIDFCNTYNKRLVHISTLSVSGNLVFGLTAQNNLLNEEILFDETNLYIGQSLENVYIRSKFEAEKLILENMLSHNLDALILRVGNITNRTTDGKFQLNNEENAFANRLKAFIELKCAPNYLRNTYAEFSPVDNIAKAILMTIQYVSPINILHIYNSNHIYIKDLVDLLPKKMIEFVDENIFYKKLKNLLSYSDNSAVSTLVNDFDDNHQLVYDSKIKLENNFTNSFFEKIGFHWSNIDKEYISKLLRNI